LWRASETAHSSSLEGAARGGALAAEALFAQPAPAGGHAEAGHAAGPRARPVH